MSDRVQLWVPAEALELARAEAGLVGISLSEWLDRAGEEHVRLRQDLRDLEAREREDRGGWHPNDRDRAA
jgi:hypothetical protein